MVNQFFIKNNDSKTVLNPNLTPFKNRRKAASFLVKVIRFWHDKFNPRFFFCFINKEGDDKDVLLENEWRIGFSTGENCRGCLRGLDVLNAIFGDWERFNELPFVKSHSTGGSSYEHIFTIGDLKRYANGRTASISQS